jgi:hypothetical protein
MSYKKQQAIEVGAQLAAFKKYCEAYWDLITDLSEPYGIALTLSGTDGFLETLKQMKNWSRDDSNSLGEVFDRWRAVLEVRLETVWIRTRYPRLVNKELKRRKLAKQKEKNV